MTLKTHFSRFLHALLLFSAFSLEAISTQLDEKKVLLKIHEILEAHASFDSITPEILQRTLDNYLLKLDPNKTYFIEEDIYPWIHPSSLQLQEIQKRYLSGDFNDFSQIHAKLQQAVMRRHAIDARISLDNLPQNVPIKDFKELKWAQSSEELKERLEKIKSLQIQAFKKLDDDSKKLSTQRIQKHQEKFEEKLLDKDPLKKHQLLLSNVLKSTASALDAHTEYFTPEEASQFLINVQQRLFGIGAQLRDNLNGFTVVKIIEGGPAEEGASLKVKDRIIAVDNTPVVGMDIVDAVELIRGPKNSQVLLTVIRGEEQEEKKVDVTIKRGEVVLKDTRYDVFLEPYGDGSIAYLRLYSFYQDPEYSSSEDLKKAFQDIKKDHNIKGIILDLRYNPGGMLSQAVTVTGLFIKKGVVVGIKNNKGKVQYLRNLDAEPIWDGPLIVLINQASASASEIVAQTLQDYGRALIVGDVQTYGKGTFQTITLNTEDQTINPEGEFKVTRGRYYTVSGKSPQQTGVFSDILIPGVLSEVDIGERFSKYPLTNDSIAPNYQDDLSDIPYLQRLKVKTLYHYDLQKKEDLYSPYLEALQKNVTYRINNNKNYKNFLEEVRKKDPLERENEKLFGQNDLQLTETFNVMKDLILFQEENAD
jgi:carboxyl-terminal processing protease